MQILKGNIFLHTSRSSPGETLETLRTGPGTRIERIISHGQHSPQGFWYDQEENEWVIVLSGKARLMFDGGEVVEMSAGDYVDIPAHQKHRVDWTEPGRDTVWLAVHYSESPTD